MVHVGEVCANLTCEDVACVVRECLYGRCIFHMDDSIILWRSNNPWMMSRSLRGSKGVMSREEKDHGRREVPGAAFILAPHHLVATLHVTNPQAPVCRIIARSISRISHCCCFPAQSGMHNGLSLRLLEGPSCRPLTEIAAREYLEKISL